MPTETLSFPDDGDVPNHPRWPMIVYARAIAPETLQSSENAFDELFGRNGWPVAWHNGIYSFTHYHSTTHEVLGIARGQATVQFGGKSGKILTASAGDALLLLREGDRLRECAAVGDTSCCREHLDACWRVLSSEAPGEWSEDGRVLIVLRGSDRRLGVLCLRCRPGLAWRDRWLGLLLSFGAQIGVALERLQVEAHNRQLVVELESAGRLERAEFDRDWVRVEPSAGDRSLIALSARGRSVNVGRFVRPELRPALAREIRMALRAA